MRSKIKLALPLLLLAGTPVWVSAKTVTCHLIEITREEVKLDCGLDQGVAAGDRGVVFYEIKIGNLNKRVTPAAFVILEVSPKASTARISKSTGELKTSYSAEVEITALMERKGKVAGTSPSENRGAPARDKTALALEALLQANAFYDSGRLEEAKIEYEKVLALMPDDPLALSRIQGIQSTLAERQRMRSQLEYFHAAEESAMAHGQYELASDYARKALVLDSNDPSSLAVLKDANKKLSELAEVEAAKRLKTPEAVVPPPGRSKAQSPTPIEPIPSPPPVVAEVPKPAAVVSESKPKGKTVIIAEPPKPSLQVQEPAKFIPEKETELTPPPVSTPAAAAMVMITSVDFMMGAPRRTARFRNEMPEHRVHLNSFYIDKYEVTNEEYKKFVDAKKHALPKTWPDGAYTPEKGNSPVTEISWFDAQAYCTFVNKRLPTEAEWEYAAGGPSSLAFPWGNRFESSAANTSESKRNGVMSIYDNPRDQSSFGVVDMGGNVSEWTADWYRAYPQNDYPEVEYGSQYRVVRGGSYRSQSFFARTVFRGFRDPRSPADDIGFRCARSASGN